MFVLIEEYEGELGIAYAHESEKECRERMWKLVKECIGEDYLFEDYHTACVEHYVPSKNEVHVRDQGAGYDVAIWNDEEAWYEGGSNAHWKIEEVR